MKRLLILVLTLIMLFCLCACGKDKSEPEIPGTGETIPEVTQSVFEVKITTENLFDYFEYREYPAYLKNDDGDTTSVQMSYGLALREGYVAANDPAHKDTMTVNFTADVVVRHGNFTVDFATLQYSGTTDSTETETVSETLKFWPKGGRTTTWTFGNYSDSYIISLENFTVTSAKGNLFLKLG